MKLEQHPYVSFRSYIQIFRRRFLQTFWYWSSPPGSQCLTGSGPVMEWNCSPTTSWRIIFSKLTITPSVDCADSYSQPHPCPIHRNWVDSSKALDDSTRFARYVSTRFARSSRLANRLPAWRIDNRGNDSCRFNRIDSNRQHFQPTLKVQINYME